MPRTGSSSSAGSYLRRTLILVAWISFACGPARAADSLAPGRVLPNVVFIVADDLGYGDVGCYGAKQLATPNLDRLAREGLRFTDAHASSATCTPSRYSFLMGEYAWRRPGTGVLPGDAGLVLPLGRLTLPGVFRRAGYATGVVGKWHLGLGAGRVDWNAEIRPGPLEVGFDSSFIMPATGDRVPCVYVRNHRVEGGDVADPIRVSYTEPISNLPTGKSHPAMLRMHPSHGHDQAIVNGISRIGYMAGGEQARWKDEDMADTFTREAVDFLERNRERRFFLYFALHDPHVPRVPHPRFAGRSGLGPRGDVIVQADACVGEVLRALERLGLARNTLVLATSDNGAVVDDGYRDQAVESLGEHRPNGPWRGGKYSKFEGGTRVPFLVRWPERVKPGVSEALVSQVDLFASFAELLGQALATDDAPDSLNLLPALLGDRSVGREHLVEHAAGLGLRRGSWKYIRPADGPKKNAPTNTELGNDPAPQLYQLADDPGETRNLAATNPSIVEEMEAILVRTRQGGRTRP